MGHITLPFPPPPVQIIILCMLWIAFCMMLSKQTLITISKWQKLNIKSVIMFFFTQVLMEGQLCSNLNCDCLLGMKKKCHCCQWLYSLIRKIASFNGNWIENLEVLQRLTEKTSKEHLQTFPNKERMGIKAHSMTENQQWIILIN